VLLGLLDPGDAHHPAASNALRSARAAGRRLVIPATVLAEVLVSASRVGPAAVATTEAFVDTIIDSVRDIDREIARSAASYRSRHHFLRLPDALVVATGLVSDADAVLTADEKWKQVDQRVDLIL
jgi:predicted nucleic acid-binding protein